MEITYPVFRLGTEKPSFEEGVIFYLRQYKDENNQVTNRLTIIDDTTLPEETLAKRRLYLLNKDVKLKSIGRAVFFLGDLIKLAHRNVWFIDSKGKVFQYKKATIAKLLYKKITLMHAIASGGAILEVEGINHRFKCLYTPEEDDYYAGVLKHGNTYILYGVYKEKHKDSWRMV